MRFNLLFSLIVFAVTGDLKWIMLFTLVTIILIFIHSFSTRDVAVVSKEKSLFEMNNTQDADPLLRGNVNIKRNEEKYDPSPSGSYFVYNTGGW
jgi:hypothetical protein